MNTLTAPNFDGATYAPARDRSRLSAQLNHVRDLMLDGVARTLSEISALVDAPEASVSARLRDLRKPKFGGYNVTRAHVAGGLYLYRVAKGAV
jgi:hypothetical protein